MSIVSHPLAWLHPDESLNYCVRKQEVAVVGGICMLSRFSHVELFASPRTVVCQAPLSMGFFRQEYWTALPCSPPGDLSDPGIKPGCFLHGRQILYHLSHQGWWWKEIRWERERDWNSETESYIFKLNHSMTSLSYPRGRTHFKLVQVTLSKQPVRKKWSINSIILELPINLQQASLLFPWPHEISNHLFQKSF